MLAHYERKKKENGEHGNYGNKSIDTSLTEKNYNLAPHRDISQAAFIEKRCSEVHCLKRKDVNVMCSWVVTLPETLVDASGKPVEPDTEKFFREAYCFLKARYGQNNVVSAYVHMDETTPHLHFAFVPVVQDKKHGRETVSAKLAVNKAELQRFHPQLSAHMAKAFGRDIGVENGVLSQTKQKNKSIRELKADTAKQCEKSLVEAQEERQKILIEARKQAYHLKIRSEREAIAIVDYAKKNETPNKRLENLEKFCANRYPAVLTAFEEDEKRKKEQVISYSRGIRR